MVKKKKIVMVRCSEGTVIIKLSYYRKLTRILKIYVNLNLTFILSVTLI